MMIDTKTCSNYGTMPEYHLRDEQSRNVSRKNEFFNVSKTIRKDGVNLEVTITPELTFKQAFELCAELNMLVNRCSTVTVYHVSHVICL